MLVSVVACVTPSYCYSSSSLGEFLDLPTVLGTKSSTLLLLVYVRLFLVYIFVSDADFSFSEVLNLLSFLGALSFKPYNFCSFRGCVHPCGSKLILWAGGMFMWNGFGPLDFLLNFFSQSSI